MKNQTNEKRIAKTARIVGTLFLLTLFLLLGPTLWWANTIRPFVGAFPLSLTYVVGLQFVLIGLYIILMKNVWGPIAERKKDTRSSAPIEGGPET